MKRFVYITALILSLPDLLAGTACLVLRHTFATRNPLQIVTDFLFQVVWGLPLAGLLFVILLVLGIFSKTRPYAALLALILNLVALGLVLVVFGVPHDFDQAIFFVPLLLALIGFGWIALRVFAPQRVR